MRPFVRWWVVFAACSVVALSALAWMTRDLLNLERAERALRREDEHHEALRLALWRMDSWLGPRVAQEVPLARFRTGEDLELRASPHDLTLALERAEALRAAYEHPTPPEPNSFSQTRRNQVELSRRAQNNLQHPQSMATGSYLPIWIGEAELCFVRRVRTSPGESPRGFVVDWNRLSEALLDQVADLFTTARLVPLANGETDPSGRSLATIGAVLETTPLLAPGGDAPNAMYATLALSWTAAVVALAAVGITLRASIVFAQRRSRFASAVSHELRTPLTVLRLYSEMLAKHMVPQDRRGPYLETLQREAVRLSRLVDNVLAFARIEEKGSGLRRECIALGDVLSRAFPSLERRALEAGCELEVDTGAAAGTQVDVDPAAVEQILFNLVDNACKYGVHGRAPRIRVSSAVEAGEVKIRVRDWGKGVREGTARTIFRPFVQRTDGAGPVTSGVGLGLALARGLSRDLDGDLTLEAGAPGASFCLSLPPV